MTPLLLRWRWTVATVVTLLFSPHYIVRASTPKILVVGSINADTFLPVSRLPSEGENLTLRPGCIPIIDVPGGKGCTQAVAASKLYGDKGKVVFVGQFGKDAVATKLCQALEEESVDVSPCGHHDDLPSGRGYVFITDSGTVSAVVSGGSNAGGWTSWKNTWESNGEEEQQVGQLDELLEHCKCILLQREVPEYVNLLIATQAKKRKEGILVIQDVGGEDRPISREMLELCDYVIPNESELFRLVQSLGERTTDEDAQDGDGEIIKCAKVLQKHGAHNVLVTCGSRGSTLVTETGHVLHQPASTLAPSNVVDETGAGDCYRAAFCVALLEGQTLQVGPANVSLHSGIPCANILSSPDVAGVHGVCKCCRCVRRYQGWCSAIDAVAEKSRGTRPTRQGQPRHCTQYSTWW